MERSPVGKEVTTYTQTGMGNPMLNPTQREIVKMRNKETREGEHNYP